MTHPSTAHRGAGASHTLFDILVLLGIAFLFAWGASLCNIDSAEDVVMVINSVTDPSLFFPGSNRIINLTGMAASWITEVQSNYHFQMMLRMILAVLWPYLASRLILRRDLCLLASLAFHAVVLAQFNDSAMNVIYGSNHPYSASLFFLFASLLLARSCVKARGFVRRLVYGVLALGTMLLASESIQASILLALMTLGSLGCIRLVEASMAKPAGSAGGSARGVALARALVGLVKSYWLVAGLFLLALALTILHGTLYARKYPEAVRSFSSGSYTSIELSTSGIVRAFGNMTGSSGGVAILLLELVLIAVLAWVARRRGGTTLSGVMVDRVWFFAVIAGSLGYVLFLSQLHHIKQNDYHYRYFIFVPLGIIWMTIASVVAALPAVREELRERFGSRGEIRAQVSALLVVATACVALFNGFGRFGMPTTECTFRGSAAHRAMGEEAARGGYFAILGSYWDVWPSTFHAWKSNGSKPLEARVFPTGYRSETLNPAMLQSASRKLLDEGYLKLLCVGRGKPNTEFGTIACGELVEFNRHWGVLPRFGTYFERRINDSRSEIRMEYRPPAARIGDHWNLAADSKSAYLLSGWMAPHADGAWTLGTEARLSFVLRCEKPADLTLEFDVSSWSGMVARRPEELGVQLLFNGKPAAQWTFLPGNRGGIRTVRLDASHIRCNSPNDLRINIDRPRKPRTSAGFTGNPDLGIAMRSLTFK